MVIMYVKAQMTLTIESLLRAVLSRSVTIKCEELGWAWLWANDHEESPRTYNDIIVDSSGIVRWYV